MQISDDQILAWLQSGKNVEQAYRLLMTKYQERLYWHIRKLVGSHEDAADVLQETFINAYRGIQKFAGKSSLYTWLYRIATNQSLTHLGKKKHSLSLDDQSETRQHTVQQHMDGAAIEQKLATAIDTLPPKQQKVFMLRYYDEMPYADMSDLLGTSIGALKASYHHAVKKIETLITS